MKAYPIPRQIGNHMRLPIFEFGELVDYVFWPIANPERWTTGGRAMALGLDAWACPEDGHLLVTRTPANWVRRPESWCPLRRDERMIGVDMLAAGRAMAFERDADAAWARQCIASATMPRMPRLLVERPIARAA